MAMTTTMSGWGSVLSNGADYADFGCTVNRIEVDELFRRYRQCGFLYPAKLQRLEPFLPPIANNWRRALRGGELLHWIAVLDDTRSGKWASITSWRSTHTGWQTQHLVSTGGGVASRGVILAGQAVRIRDGWDHAHQNWFRPQNRFASAMFGSLPQALAPGTAVVHENQYLMFPLPSAKPYGRRIEELDGAKCPELAALASAARGPIYTAAEELDRDDLRLDEVDRLYRLVGLRRWRRIWIATGRRGEPVGAAIAYRGPLGFNFSFLENRCDILIEPAVAGDARRSIVRDLLAAAANAYVGFELGAIPVATDPETATVVRDLGGEPVRRYNQAIWLRAGFADCYRHVDRMYEQRTRGRSSRPRESDELALSDGGPSGSQPVGGKSRS